MYSGLVLLLCVLLLYSLKSLKDKSLSLICTSPEILHSLLVRFQLKGGAPWGQHGLASGADRTAQRRLAQRFLPQPLRGFRAAAAAGAAGSGWAIGAEAAGGRGDRGAASRFFREGKQPVYAKFVMYGDNFYVTTDNFHGKKKCQPVSLKWSVENADEHVRCSAPALFCHLVFNVSNFNFNKVIFEVDF